MAQTKVYATGRFLKPRGARQSLTCCQLDLICIVRASQFRDYRGGK